MPARRAVFILLAIGALTFAALGQKRPVTARTVIFAVLNDGKSIEPIGYLDQKGKLTGAIDGASERKVLNAFHKSYFPKGRVYPLIFGGKAAGSVTIVSSDPAAECGNFEGTVKTTTTRVPLRGSVMALATNAKVDKPGSGIRRMPTAAERSEMESLVRAEFIKNGVAEAGTTNLRSLNLTALDVDSDANAEVVGSYWVETSPKERGLLFFIAQRGSDGRYVFGYAEFSKVTKSDTMSEDIKDVDSGIYHERLLDIFDVDSDGISEIFSYSMSFEGASFNVYKRNRTGWAKHYEGINYHCAY